MQVGDHRSGARARRLAGFGAVVTAAALAAGTVAAPAAAADEGPELRFRDARIDESSGLAVGGHDRGVLWTHNDSGDRARLFAVDVSGQTRAVLRLRDVDARDWEALAGWTDPSGVPWLFVGDIGDNAERRERVVVHRVEEPRWLGDDRRLTPTTYRFRYADGPHDAETLLVDPATGRLYVVTKQHTGAGVYAAPEVLSTTDVNLLTRVADAPAIVTDGTFLPDGRVALRDYSQVHLYDRLGGTAVVLPLPRTGQGESLATTPDGLSLLVGTEGRRSPVYSVPVPAPEPAPLPPA